MNTELCNILESLLFATKKPLLMNELEQIVEASKEEILFALEELKKDYEDRGINIIEVAGGWQMGTAPKTAQYVDKLLRSPIETTLTPASLETLAIIAYKQPITKQEIERIRGVFSDSSIDTLIAKKLIEEIGRSEVVGRPILYATTDDFLKHFGLKDLKALPPLPEASHPFKDLLHEQGS